MPAHLRALPTLEDTDAFLLVLRDSQNAVERMNAFRVIKTLPRDLIRARMEVVRPWNSMADGFQQATHMGYRADAKNCVCLIGSTGYEKLIFACIDSIVANGGEDFSLLVLCADTPFYDLASRKLENSPRALAALIKPIGRVCTWIKTAQLLAPKIVKADNYVLLEADTLILANLSELFRQMDGCDESTVFGVAPNNPYHTLPMQNHIEFLGGASKEDLPFICGDSKTSAKFVFNGGLYAGKRKAIETLNSNLASLWPFSVLWAEGGTAQRYGEEVMTNWAVTMPNLEVVTLDDSWNDQSCVEFKHLGHTELEISTDGVRVTRDGKRSKILHVLGDRTLDEPRPFFWETLRAINEYGLAA